MNVLPEAPRDNKEKLLKNWYAQEVKKATARLIEKWEPVLGVKAGAPFSPENEGAVGQLQYPERHYPTQFRTSEVSQGGSRARGCP